MNDSPVPQRMVLILWLLSGLVLIVALGVPPVTRTQEARVLETSRQMLGTGWQGWMLPQLNGEPRLKKPPLCYWMTATSYLAFGVNEFPGRLPFAIVGWLILGVTYVIANRAFGQRAALFSCLTLLGTHLFFRHTRLAETDIPATLFVTLAIGAFWRSAFDPRAIWFHLAAAAIALAILSKGAPAIFVLLFLIGFCAIERRWDVALRFVKTGAIVTLLAVAVPWFVYVHIHEGTGVFATELKNTATGGDHFDWPTVFIPWLLSATAPWAPVVIAAVIIAARHWKTEPAVRAVFIWILAIFIPLCLNGNKQLHYLLTVVPPLMILTGWWISRWPWKWQKVAAIASAVAILGMSAVVNIVGPMRMPLNSRSAAAQIKTLGATSYVFYGPNLSIPLCFNLRTPIPLATDQEKLLEICKPGMIVIAQTKNNRPPPTLPPSFVHRLRIDGDEQFFDCYELQQP